jgi:hypothetical protein
MTTQALLVTLVSVVTWCLPLLAGHCRPLPEHTDTAEWSLSGTAAVHHLVRHNCQHGHHNELASLFLVESDHVSVNTSAYYCMQCSVQQYAVG